MFCDKSFFNYDDPLIHIVYPSLLATLVEPHGIGAKALLSKAGISPNLLDNANSRVSLRDFVKLVETALEVTGDPILGLRFGSKLNIASSGHLSTALLASATLGDALVLCLKYYPANGITMDLAFERQGEEVHSICPDLKQLATPVQRFMMETWITAWISHCRYLVQKPITFSELHVTYEQPSYAQCYDEYFGCPVIFESEQNKVVYPVNLLKQPLPTANQVILDLSEQQCEERLVEVSALESLPGRVADILIHWNGEQPSVSNVAHSLKLTPRSMSKQLSDQGTSYQEIFNDIRRRKALHYIQSGRHSVETIAEKLGFSDASNFRKAFKRWTGMPPSSFRPSGVA